MDKNQYLQIIEHLIEKDFFKPAMHGGAKQLQAGERWEKLYEERALYSNMTGTNESAVVIDNMTGRLVGYLDSRMPVGSIFLMGGYARRVTATQGLRVVTRAEPNTENVRKAPNRWNWRVKSAALTRSLAIELGFPVADETGAIPLVNIQTGKNSEKRTLLFHCAGEVYGKAIGELLETEKQITIVEHNEFFVEISGEMAEIDLQFSEQEILRLFSRRWKNFESAFDLGRFQTDLPTEVRRACVIAAFNLPKFRVVCSNR